MPRRPEVLAPAGDEDSLAAALAAGADAVYFGLDAGFNARARAANFSVENLAATVARVHRAGARAYLAVNTLVFEAELAHVEDVVRRAAAAGVDALIVQDPAVALLARAACPSLELHASTQMTVSSPEAARFAAGLGVTRVVVPRELSVDEIRRFAQGTPLELEVFIHGALCVSWSGQCLTSEAWGGRSANRGQCAQSCRLPYDLVVDGDTRDLGDVKYLLSPKDLAGAAAVPALVEIGVHGLKIEGRQKGPEYVATAVAGYRRWVDAVAAGAADAGRGALDDDLGRMALAYTRGFSGGFLDGADHQVLVEGRAPKHRGRLVGRVVAVEKGAVRVARETDGLGPLELRAGMGVVFDGGRPDTDEPGGPIFGVDDDVLRFGTPGPDLARVSVGDRVWATGDPAIARAAARLVEAGEPEGRIGVRLEVAGRAGAPLRVCAIAQMHNCTANVTSESALAPSRGAGLGADILADKLGALGGTPFRRERLDVAALAPGLHLPVSELKAMRRALVAELLAAVEKSAVRAVEPAPAVPRVRAALDEVPAPRIALPDGPTLVPLCRSDAQLEAVIAAGLGEVELDWMELVGLGRAVARARGAGLRVTLATVRVQKPGEEGYDGRLARLAPDGVLVRHWGGLVHFSERSDGNRPALHGDFSLNVTNSLTARHLLRLGLDTLTVAHDLDQAQLFALLAQVPPSRITVPLHHHIATFHTEHCVYAHLLSTGRDWRDCGRPCEAHAVSLRDRVGLEHPVVVDVGCRNTVFNAQAQSAASLVPKLVATGVRRFRVEFVRETQAEAATVLDAYRALLDGRISPSEAVRRVGVHEQFGVVRGTMRVLG